ncbi:MAG: YihY family inner membrane protein [Desulfuromonadales bacterium]|nr:YihY family inner membrane protein [Desulfuromonadales bacterium]
MTRLRDDCERLTQFLSHELWQVRLADQPKWRRVLLRQLQLWVLIGREFVADRCLLHATALAFTSLLSLIPLLALMFAVLKSFGVQNYLQPLLLEHLSAGSESVATAIITYINNTNVAQLGAIGLVALVLSALSLISRVEKSFNDIWGVKETRSIQQRVTSYFSVVTIGPVFVVAAISMTGSLESQLVVQWLLDMALVGTLLILLFKVLPFVVMWLVFAGLYLCIPNTRVAPRAALIGGVFSGTLWQLSQWVYVDFQIGVARYNAIYGTLAALPVFMIWLYLAWAILLFGLEVTYALQNLQSVRRDLRGGRVSIAGRTRVILVVLLHLARRFQCGEPAPSAELIAAELKIPPRLLRGILDLLQRQGLVAELVRADGASGFLPAREPDTIQMSALLGSIAADGTDYLPPGDCAEHAVVVDLVDSLTMAAGRPLAGVTLRDLVEQSERKGQEGLHPVVEL